MTKRLVTRRILIAGDARISPATEEHVREFVRKQGPSTLVVSTGQGIVAQWVVDECQKIGQMCAIYRTQRNWPLARRDNWIVKAVHDVAVFWNAQDKWTERIIEKALKAGKNVAVFDVFGKVQRFMEPQIDPPRKMAKSVKTRG